MKRTALRLAALFVFIICLGQFFVACAPVDRIVDFFADDGTGHIFKIAIENNPQNLDPQLAYDAESVAISKNLFAGLMDYDENGQLTCRLAKDYVISDDGLSYTFHLKEGYGWYASGEFKEPVTAGDFVFGFRRLMDPKTASPHSEKYFCISGAKSARNGEIPPSEIGVNAVDDYTVEFTLEYPNAEFLYLLAELPSMPCCEKFFNEKAGGKYGLEAEATCSNGPFYVRFWQHDPYGSDNYVRLRRNPEYSAQSYVSPSGVNYLVNPDYSDRKADFSEGTTEVILFTPPQNPASEDNAVLGYADTAGIVFNENISAFSDPDIRQIFSWAADRDAIKRVSSENLLIAESLIPKNPRISSRGYDYKSSEDVCSTNSAMAEYKWSFVLNERQKSELIGMTVLVPEDFEYASALSELTNSWYQILGIHFSMEYVNSVDYEKRIKSGEYDMALVTVSSDTACPADYIAPFGTAAKYGIRLDSAENVESMRGRCETLQSLNSMCAEAEDEILSEYHFLPLFYVPTACVFDDDAQDLDLDPFSKTVYFENAKMF